MKLFIKLLAAFVVLLVVGAVALVALVDPNDYKEQIQAQVKNSTGRTLLINGDIGWTFFPSLGISSGETMITNPEGFNRDNLLKIDDVAVSIDVMPLLKGEIKIGDITLNGLVINVILNKDGSNNLEFKSAEATGDAAPAETTGAAQETATEEQAEQFFALDKLEVAGIYINNTAIEIQDLKAGSTTAANIEKIELGRFALGESADLTVLTEVVIDKMNAEIELQSKLIVAADFSSIQLNEFQLTTLLTGEELPNGKVTTSVNAEISYDVNNSLANINDLILLVDAIELKGQASVQTAATTKVRFDLQGNEWDLTPYIVASDEAETAAAAPASTPTSTGGAAPAEVEPDLSGLNGLDVEGTFGIAGIKVEEIKIGKVDSKIIVKNGKAELKPLTAQLYQGMLTVNGSVTDAKGLNKYSISSKLNGVQIRPLLTDAVEIDFLSGTTAFNFNGAGQGLTSTKIKSGLSGNGDFKLLDGELYGVNIPQELRILKAKLSGKKAPTEANIKKTDFASLTGNFTIKKGQVDNKKLLMASPVMRLDGSGIANILTESLKYNLSVTPLSKKGEETDLKDLNGVTIPFVISGTFTQPKFALDTDGALKAKLDAEQKRLEKKLKDKTDAEIKKESDKLEKKLKGKLDKLFG